MITSSSPDRPVSFPVSLVVTGRSCLVVGGGHVAARKVATLVRCGALVTVVAPDIVPAIDELTVSEGVVVLRRPYQAGEAGAYRLVVTATGDRLVDGAVAGDADDVGVWVNSADDPEHCSFMLPSVHRDGPVSVAVSTGGASPALATWLRRRLGEACGPGLGDLALLLEEARRRLQDQGRSTESIDWQSLLDGPLPTFVATGRISETALLFDAIA